MAATETKAINSNHIVVGKLVCNQGHIIWPGIFAIPTLIDHYITVLKGIFTDGSRERTFQGFVLIQEFLN